MKLDTLIDLKAPRFRRGGAAALVTAMVLAAAVLLNLLAARIPLKADLSDKKLYSLSERTLSIAKNVAEDTIIYACFKEDSAPTEIAEALQRYADASPRISLKWVDLEKDPGFAKRYAGDDGKLDSGAVVVVGTASGRFRTIPYYNLYEIGYDQQTGRQTVQGIRLEQEVTGALAYVASGKTYAVYELTGHGEYTLADYGLAEDMAKQNRKLSSLSLMAVADVPSDAALVLILSPKSDLSSPEAGALRRYLERGGDLAAFVDPGTPMPVLEDLLAAYGVKREDGLVMEGSEAARLAGNPFFLLPNLEDHDITKPLIGSKLAVTYPAASALTESALHRSDAKLAGLLTTSSNSWIRTNLADKSITRKTGDIPGPFTLAYAVEVLDPHGKPTTRLVVAGSSYFVSPANPAAAPGNRDLFLDMVAWTIGDDQSISIGPKYFFSLPFQANGAVTLALLAIFIVLIPGGLLATGIVVWLRRRNR